MNKTGSPSITEYFSEITDPRIERGKLHKLSDIIVIAICAVISGADGWEAIEDYGNYDRGCGTGGFLAQSFEYIRNKLGVNMTADHIGTLKNRTFWGREKENLIYPIALANLICPFVPTEFFRNMLAPDPADHL
jgi:hypothetical protein